MPRTAATKNPLIPTTPTRPTSGRRVVRSIGALMALEAVSLAVAATLHLSGQVHGRGKPFDADHAGVAETIICIVLASGAFAVLRASVHARAIALTTTGLAIVGFGVGLTMTTQGGDLPDIAYHLTVLPLLVASMVVLVWGRSAPRRAPAQNPSEEAHE